MSTKRNPNAAPCRLINKYLCRVIIFFLANYLVMVKRKISYVKSVYRALIPSMLAFKTSFPEFSTCTGFHSAEKGRRVDNSPASSKSTC